MPKIIVLMGAPGAGKGTQARLLQERLYLPQISTGDIFRSLKNAETPLAREVREIMNAGHLVPDELTTRLVRERTSQPDTQNGYILDGYPAHANAGSLFGGPGAGTGTSDCSDFDRRQS
jgi:adenylate kinase